MQRAYGIEGLQGGATRHKVHKRAESLGPYFFLQESRIGETSETHTASQGPQEQTPTTCE